MCQKKHTSENDHGASDIRILLFGAGSPETKCFPTLCEPASHSRALTGVERDKQDPEKAFTCLREEGALGGRGCEDTVFRSPFCSRKDQRETRERESRQMQTPLVVRWLRLHIITSWGQEEGCSIPGWGSEIPCAVQHNQNKNEKGQNLLPMQKSSHISTLSDEKMEKKNTDPEQMETQRPALTSW